MKSGLSEKDFWYFILQLADYKEKHIKVRKKKLVFGSTLRKLIMYTSFIPRTFFCLIILFMSLFCPVVATQAVAQKISTPNKHPNIVFILTDDLTLNLVQYMPHVLKMQKEGATFANYFVTDSLCCPSRATIFTGLYPHDTGVFSNKGKYGGYTAFQNRGDDRKTFATALSAAGYRTAMLGKYLNFYFPEKDPVGLGWTSWAVGGEQAYAGFNYILNEDGKVVKYGNKPTDYLTDVLSGLAVRFIKHSAGAPFLIEVATFTPHLPCTPAPRDADALPGLSAPVTPMFNAVPDVNAAKWLLEIPPLSKYDMGGFDKEFRMRAQSVLAVDKMIGELQAAVAAIGEENNTYFVFSSDNGYHMGEYRLLAGKMTPYDTDIQVPLIVTGPGVPAGLTIDEITQNTDLCPTFNEIGGAADVASVDGRSLVPLLQGQKLADWRTVALIEHKGPLKWDPEDLDTLGLDEKDQRYLDRKYAWRHGNPTAYEAIRGPTLLYVEYVDGEKEYHDLATDPYELHNSFSLLSSVEKASLHATLAAVRTCHDAKSCRAAEHLIHLRLSIKVP